MKFSAAILSAALMLSCSGGVEAFAPTTTTTRSIVSRSDETTSSLHMVQRNPNFAKLAGGYLFPEIGRRRSAYVEENPDMASRIISLGIGDTTEPIPEHILTGLVSGASKLGNKETYTGYGDVQGRTDLRQKIADTLYAGTGIEAEEVFVSGESCFLLACPQWCGTCISSQHITPSIMSRTISKNAFLSLFSATHRRRQVRHYASAANVWCGCGECGAGSILSRLRGHQRHAGTDGQH